MSFATTIWRAVEVRLRGDEMMSNWMRAPVLGLLVAGLVAVTTGCSHEGHHEEHGTYAATTPLRKETTVVKDYVAQIRSVQHIELRAMERGYLEEIYVDEGQFVEEGQRMFRIMPRVYEAELQAAKAETEFAQIEYDNTRALQENNVVSPNELKLAKAKLDKAAAEQQLAQVHVSLTEVRAPFDGIMNRLEVRKGSLLEEGELLSTLSDNHEMWVYFNVTEAEYLDYKQRLSEDDEPATVQLMMANHQLFPYEGKVSTIEADFNNETGNIAFRATFPNPDGLLRHGETGKVLMSTPIDNALLVPQKATFEILDKRYVFVVDEEGVVHQRRIEVLEELPHVFVVGDGVEADDHILIDGLRKVQDGEEVSIQLEAPEEAFAHLDVHAE